MYVETDFLLALIELLLIAYREELDTERVIANASCLIDVRSDVETVVAASSHVEEHGFVPFDALHLVESDGDTVVSSDGSYEGFAPRLDLSPVDEQARETDSEQPQR